MVDDGQVNCRYYVDFGAKAQAAFTEVSGLTMEVDVLRYEEGGNNGAIYSLPGRAKVSNLTLKRGITKSNDFLDWCTAVAQGKDDRRNVSVTMYDVGGKVLARWDLFNAFAVKWSGPQFTADGRAVAIETLELAHDGLKQNKQS